jgi:hypothetical protein
MTTDESDGMNVLHVIYNIKNNQNVVTKIFFGVILAFFANFE